jgi:hypothetical protein
MLIVAITGFPKVCCILIADSTADILSFANGLSVHEKPVTFSSNLCFFISAIMASTDAP